VHARGVADGQGGLSSAERWSVSCREQVEELSNLDIPKPSSLAFSTSGRLFAAAGSTCTIELYDTFTRKPITWFRGHASTITGICWSDDDTVLFSCSSGGAAYQWDVRTHQRIAEAEFVDRSHNFQACTTAKVGQGFIVRDASGCISMLHSGQIQASVSAPKGFAIPFCLLGNDQILVVGAQQGHLLVWPWRQMKAADSQNEVTPVLSGLVVPAHAARVRHLCVCCDGDVLLSAAEDGTVVAWDIRVHRLCCMSAACCKCPTMIQFSCCQDTAVPQDLKHMHS
jgi:WD40 repeat protein